MTHPQPLVTIGIPTYNRPQLLKRALTAVANQSYENLQVLVSDNCTPGCAVQDVVDEFEETIGNCSFNKHPENIGAIQNYFSLLDAAKGEYFMWLADDDEISSNYVSALVDLLEKNPDASSATGNLFLMSDESNGEIVPTSNFPHSSPVVRAIQFVWRSDDTFFHSVHRTAVLRKASFPGYWWPNKGFLLNWSFVFLFDMVLAGRILIPDDLSVQYINHCYVPKLYIVRRYKSWSMEVMSYILRRLNVHCLFMFKASRVLNPLVVFPIVLVSFLALCREFGIFFGGVLLAPFRRKASTILRHRG
jgi:glycosyltransferase involved in cell wall biosynthesis